MPLLPRALLAPLTLLSMLLAPTTALVDVYTQRAFGYACYRIPALLRTPNGTLHLFAEGRKFSCNDHGFVDLVVRSSSDGGSSWGPLLVVRSESSAAANVTIGNPAPVALDDNHLLLPFSRDNTAAAVLHSADGGATWALGASLPVDARWRWVATGPPGALRVVAGALDRLVVPADHQDAAGYASHAYLSDDGGASWTVSTSVPQGNECQAAALPWVSASTLLLSMRSVGATRLAALSSDGGATWGPAWPTTRETECEGSVVALPAHRVLVQSSAFAAKRTNLTLHTSRDDGKTWLPVRQVYAGAAAYSSLALVGPAQVAVAFERDAYAAISLDVVDVPV